MDLCSGACGLSNGLEQAGVARACWAVKNFPSGSDRVAEPCHFSAAPEPSIFFTAPEPEPAPAPTYIASHQFLKINAYGTLFFSSLNCFIHGVIILQPI